MTRNSTLTSMVLAVSLLSSAAAFSASKKDNFQCVDSTGKEVMGVKGKKDCASPNKWTKQTDKTSASKSPAGAPKQN